MRISGASHISLTVSDLDRSVAWYQQVFGAEVTMQERGDERSATLLAVPGTSFIIGLGQFRDQESGPFDPHRPGLDHFAFAVADLADMHAWAARFDELGVEHSGVLEVPIGAFLNFKDPDRIALAFFWRRPA